MVTFSPWLKESIDAWVIHSNTSFKVVNTFCPVASQADYESYAMSYGFSWAIYLC